MSLSTKRQIRAARRRKARNNKPRGRRTVRVNADPVSEFSRLLARRFDQVLGGPLKPVPYNDAGLSLFSAVFSSTLNRVSGYRAPVRKRRARVAKKIAKRGGAAHFAPIVFADEGSHNPSP